MASDSDTIAKTPAPLPASEGYVGQRRAPLGGWLGFNGLMLVPALLLMALFLLGPAIAGFKVALESWSGFAPKARFVGLGNFRQLFNWEAVGAWFRSLFQRGAPSSGDFFADDIFRAALTNSVLWMIVGGIAHFFFALVLANGLQNPRLRFKKYFQTLLIFPMFISAIGVAVLWRGLYDPRKGLINLGLSIFHLSDPTQAAPAWLSPDNGVYPLILVSVWGSVGGQIVLILAGLRQIPESLYEAARIDGASEWQCFWRISLPLMRGILKIAVVLWVIEALQVFGLVQGMLGPDIEPNHHVVSTYMFDMAFNNRSNIFRMGQATAMALVLVAITVTLVLVIHWAYTLIFGKDKLEF